MHTGSLPNGSVRDRLFPSSLSGHFQQLFYFYSPLPGMLQRKYSSQKSMAVHLQKNGLLSVACAPKIYKVTDFLNVRHQNKISLLRITKLKNLEFFNLFEKYFFYIMNNGCCIVHVRCLR